MIYKITWEDGRIDWCTAKSQIHLLKSYQEDYEFELQEIEDIEEISDEKAKEIMVDNTEYDEGSDNNMPEEISLFDLGGNYIDFQIIASSE